MSIEVSRLQFGPFIVDGLTKELRRDGELVPLSAKVFELLLYFVHHPGRPLLKSELLDALWSNSFVEESNLTQNVFILRKALGASGATAIRTLPGRGYQFDADVVVPAMEVVPTLAATLANRGMRVVYEEETEDHFLFLRSPAMWLLASAVLALVCVASWLGWRRWEDRTGGPPVQIVMADLEGGTGDPLLDRTLNDIMRMELSQSPFVSIVSNVTVQRTMTAMTRKATDPVTVPLAREICERSGSQAVLHGTVVRVGSHYEFTEEALNCADDTSLAAVDRSVSSAEGFPTALRTIAATIRHDLGESRRTIRRFNAPLDDVSTGSLEALKDFTEANSVAQKGHFPEGIELLKQAVAVDPKFAAAYLNLAIYSLNSLDNVGGNAYLRKAYANRDSATRPTQLFIAALYDTIVTRDLFASLRDYQAWADIYPRSPQPWSGLQNVNLQLGRPAAALAPAKKMVELAPANASALQALAATQIAVGDFASARTTCELALRKGMDSEGFRYLLLRLGHLQKDNALVDAQLAWLKDHPNSPILLSNAAVYAVTEGRLTDAQSLFDQMTTAFTNTGQSAAATRVLQDTAVAFAGIEEPETARRLLHLAPVDGDFNEMLATADLGDSDAAEGLLRRELTTHPQATLLALRFAPLVRGDIALHSGKPDQAIAAMESSRPFDGEGADGFYLRGIAYLQARRYPEAEAEFRQLLLHPEIEANAYQLPLSRVQLARVLALEGRCGEAMSAYQEFLRMWSHANGHPKLLARVTAEVTYLDKDKANCRPAVAK